MGGQIGFDVGSNCLSSRSPRWIYGTHIIIIILNYVLLEIPVIWKITTRVGNKNIKAQ